MIDLGSDITLHNGDCVDVMLKAFDNECRFDLIVADYPFNCQDGRKKEDYEHFVSMTARCFDILAKPVCNLVVINSPAKIFTTSLYFQSWTLINEIALIRRGSLRPAYHFGFQHNTCLILNKGGIKNKWNGTKKNHDKTFDTDVIPYQNGYRGKGKNNWHPQALPLDLTRKLVSYLSDEGDNVLDVFGGSGTTGVVCKELKRKCTLIEFNDKYFEMIKNRIGYEG